MAEFIMDVVKPIMHCWPIPSEFRCRANPGEQAMRWVFLLFVLSSVGCTHHALQKQTVRTSGTLADLQYQQVLDNLARFHANPDAMPSAAILSSGTVSLNDQASAGFSPTYAPTLTFAQQGGGPVILQMLVPFSGQRSLTENWSLTPVTDADNLRRLRCAYRLLVLGDETPNAEFCRKEIKEFFAGESAALVDYYPPRGWYFAGCKKDVPKDALYVGSHGDVYVWVMANGMNGLSLFTMGALDLATGKLRTPQRTVVRKFRGEPVAENLVETQVTTMEDDPNALDDIRKGRTRRGDRQRTVEPGLNPGLLFVPK
jgi:hypothetical protein